MERGIGFLGKVKKNMLERLYKEGLTGNMAEDFIKDINSIKELINAVAEAKVDFKWEQLTGDDKGYKIRINASEKKKSGTSVPPIQMPVSNIPQLLSPVDVISVTPQNAASSQNVLPSDTGNTNEQPKEADENIKTVTSPLVGTFYSAASPEDEPFVKVGDKVVKGQKLGIIEAMKLMNDIESDFDGEIVEILVSNESVVEYGQPLFKIR